MYFNPKKIIKRIEDKKLENKLLSNNIVSSKYYSGDVIIDEDFIYDNLGLVTYIAGNVFVHSNKFKNFSNLKAIGGSLIIVESSNLLSLGKLQNIGCTLTLDKTKITSLLNIRQVNSLILSDNEFLKDLGKLEFIPGTLGINGLHKSLMLSNLKKVNQIFFDKENSNLEIKNIYFNYLRKFDGSDIIVEMNPEKELEKLTFKYYAF